MATHQQLEAKVEGTIKALGTMSAKEREAAPSLTFGQEYNKLLGQVAELYQDLKDVLPPKVETFTPVSGGPLTSARFVEMHAYYEQLQNFLFQKA